VLLGQGKTRILRHSSSQIVFEDYVALHFQHARNIVPAIIEKIELGLHLCF
jgi:hypothetical protein